MKRKENHKRLLNGLEALEQYLSIQKATPNSDPSWFGFLITINDDMEFTRNDMSIFLENNKIQTRNLFAGNVLRHPLFDSMTENVDYRVVGKLENTDKIMNDSFWIGLYPGMGNDAIDYMVKIIREFLKAN